MQNQHKVVGGVGVAVVVLVVVAVVVTQVDHGGPQMEDLTDWLPRQPSPSMCPPRYGRRATLLVSLDGFRPDYLDRGQSPVLSLLRQRGVTTNYTVPAFPTETFPNHYTIVTGLYPESHGIVSNNFYDPEWQQQFSVRGAAKHDGKWWGGEPIWNTLSRQDRKSATFFWPGSDADIGGRRPTYWHKYNESVPFRHRVDQVLEWLSMEEEDRPSFVSLYFEQPDGAGHATGPYSEEVNSQLAAVDVEIEYLLRGLISRDILHCVNVVVVSDHGMSQVTGEGILRLSEYNLPEVTETNMYQGSLGRIRLQDEGMRSALLRNLSCLSPNMRPYAKEHLPARLHYSNSPRIESVLVKMADTKAVTYSFTINGVRGFHGYDNRFPSMKSLFIGYGPDLQTALEVAPFENIELYNLLCDLTGVLPAPNNGTTGALYHVLANPPPPTPVQVEKPPTARLSGDEDTRATINCAGESSIQKGDWESLRFTRDAEKSLEDVHLPWGTPGTNPALDVTLLHHPDHVTGYSKTLKVPAWVSFTVSSKGQSPANQQAWVEDVRLDPSAMSTCPQYAALNLSMAPLFPPAHTLNHSHSWMPYLVTNAVAMTPGVGVRLARLLEHVVEGGAAGGPLNVLLGPMFDADADSSPDDIGLSGSPAIPSDYFAVISRCRVRVSDLGQCPPRHIDAYSFIFPQTHLATICMTMSEYADEFSSRARDVELKAGLVLFPDVAVAERLQLLLRFHTNSWADALK